MLQTGVTDISPNKQVSEEKQVIAKELLQTDTQQTEKHGGKEKPLFPGRKLEKVGVKVKFLWKTE
jgi:hypothetical protein